MTTKYKMGFNVCLHWFILWVSSVCKICIFPLTIPHCRKKEIYDGKENEKKEKKCFQPNANLIHPKTTGSLTDSSVVSWMNCIRRQMRE